MSERIPESQFERNADFTAAVRAGDARRAAILALAEPLPTDASDEELERWRVRRRLYRTPGRKDRKSPASTREEQCS